MITITSTSTVVTLNTPETLSFNTTKNVQLVKFAGGSEALLDKGKSNEFLLINGREIINVEEKMRWLNFIMDNREIVSVSGLPSESMNDHYFISELDFSRSGGEPCEYDWVITLDRIYDDLILHQPETFSPLLYDTIGFSDDIIIIPYPTYLVDTIDISDYIQLLFIEGYIKVNYYVYGNVTDDTTPLSSVTVYARDTDLSGPTESYTTGANGQYQINLKGVAKDGNNVRVWAVYDGNTIINDFILDISQPNKLINFDFTYYIPVNYFVYGKVTYNTVNVSGATVYAQDITKGGPILECYLDESGMYQINLKDSAVDGNTIKVWCSKDGKTDEETFTLNISNPNEKVDLELV